MKALKVSYWCSEGKIQDVFIDLRKNSNTFEQYTQNMSPETGWIYIPKGFAHGFCTLTDNVQVLYKVGSYYSKENEQELNGMIKLLM